MPTIAIRPSSPPTPAGGSSAPSALGLSSSRFGAALRTFVDRCANAHRHQGQRPRPGSYAWPERRQEAETVWSRGGSFEQGLAAALAAPPDLRIRTPSTRTVRRWWGDRRWLGRSLTLAEIEPRTA